MTAQTILPANTLSGAYEVANSARFEADTRMTKSASSGNTRTFTISFWCKRAALGAVASGSNQFPISFYEDSSNRISFAFLTANTFIVYAEVGGAAKMNLTTNRVFRDTSAWMHFVIKIDTTQGTASNRAKIYINGVQETSFSTETYPDENQELKINTNIYIGTYDTSNNFYHGYLAEVVFIDGTALDQTSFGEFDDDTPTIWKPKNVGGLTFGTNGFYLDFEDSGNLGNDKNGGTDLSETNLAATDQSTDTCTNNFATINPLDNYYNAATFSEGNLKITTATSGGYAPTVSNFGVNSGKWYAECKYVSRSHSDNYSMIGVRSTQTANTNYLGENTNDYAYYSGNGKTYSGGSASNYGNSFDQDTTIGIYLDLDNNKLYFSKDGTLQNSGTGVSITAPGSTSLGNYFFSAMDYGNSVSNVYEWNFGGGTPTSISSGNADDNGYGNFEYSPNITGDGAAKSFYALNTKNIAEFG